MKDITDEVLKDVIGNKDKRTLVMDGVEVELPEDIATEIVKSQRIFEVDDLGDLSANYKEFSKRTRIPLKWISFIMKHNKKSLTNKASLKEHATLMAAHKKEYDEVISDFPSKWNLIQGKIHQHYTFYMHGMRLENINHTHNPLFGAYTFDIVDSKGNRIPGVYADYKFTETMIHKKNETNTKEKIDMMKSSIPIQPFIITGFFSNTKFKIIVLRLQDGGREVRPDLPFVRAS